MSTIKHKFKQVRLHKIYAVFLLFLVACGSEGDIKQVKPTSRTGHDTYISGGTAAGKGQFPWLVSIQATNFQVGYHLCGGVLLKADWVLTAAHCLDSEKPEWLWVVTGEHDMSIEEGTEQRLTVDFFIQHPDYVYWEKPYINDVALIHLATPAFLNKFTRVAPLPTGTTSDFSVLCHEAGWGATSTSGLGSDVLQFAVVYRLNSSICSKTYHSFPSGQICAGNVEGVGFCAGDNGGPLHCTDTSGRYIVAGIMSWREGCAQSGKPGVYMDSVYYSPWIYDVIKNNNM